MNEKILITGASGFVGSFLIEEGLRRQMLTWAGIRKTSTRQYLQDERIRFVELDFIHLDALNRQLSAHKKVHGGWDYIVHCAGITKCRRTEDFERVNHIGTKNFVDALQALDMVPKKFIYISTLGVFGPIHEKDYRPIRENDEPQPDTAYGRSKLESEHVIASRKGWPYIIFRPTGIYGPREKDYFLMVKAIKNHVDFSVGFKKQLITFVYVKDLVQAIYKAVEKKVVRRTYCLTDGHVYTGRSFSDYLRKELGNPWVIRIKSPLFVLKAISWLAEFAASCLGKVSTLNRDKYKIMKQRNWQCDITPAATELGYTPEYPLERGVKEIVSWYKEEGWI